MKPKLFASLVTVAVLSLLRAQEPQAISAEELAKATPLLLAANARLGDLPLKLDLDPDQVAGFKVGDVGAIIIPDKRFKEEKGDQAGRKGKGAPVPVGQLWTSKLSPVEREAVIPNEKLRFVKVAADDKELELAVFTLGIEKAGKKGFQLVVYGKDSVPVLRVPMTAAKTKGAAPLVMTARKTGEERGVLELKLLGRYKVEIPVGKPAE